MVARLRTRVGLDEAIGGALAAVALVLMLLIGIHDARRPVYGPIDELTHTAYVLAVARTGSRPRSAATAHSCEPDRSLHATCAFPARQGRQRTAADRALRGGAASRGDPAPSLLLRRRTGDVVRVRARQGGRAAPVRRLPLPVRGHDHLPRRLRHRRDRAGRGHRDAPVCQRKRPDGRLELRDERDDDAPPGRSCDLAEPAGDPRPAADVAAHIRRRRARDHAHHRRAAGRALPARARGRADTRAGTGGAAPRREAGARRGDPAQPVGALESRALPLGRAPGARRQRHRRARLGHDRQRQRVRVRGAVLPLVHHAASRTFPPAG